MTTIATTKVVKSSHPGYIPMIREAILSLQGSALKSEINAYIETNYPRGKYKISTGSAFIKALQNNLNKTNQFTLDKNTKKYKINTTTKQKSKTKTKSSLPHRTALSKYRCCEICERMSVDDMEYFLKIVVNGCDARIKIMPQWNEKLEAIFVELDKDKDGMIDAKGVEYILLNFAGYKTKKISEQVAKIMGQSKAKDIGLITFMELLFETPRMHRFHVYHYVLVPEFCQKGYGKYGESESHPIATIFRNKANKVIPNDYYKKQ
eukprot:177386_1